MEHKNAERYSGKVYRLFELLGHTEGQLYIAEIAVLITLLIGTAVYITAPLCPAGYLMA